MRSILFCAVFLLSSSLVKADTVSKIGFVDIITENGPAGIAIFGAICFLSVVGFFLGILAVVLSATGKSPQPCLAVKLLISGALVLFLLGFLGAVSGAIHGYSSAALHTSPSAALAKTIAEGITYGLWSLFYAFVGCIEYIFFLTISFILLHSKTKTDQTVRSKTSH